MYPSPMSDSAPETGALVTDDDAIRSENSSKSSDHGTGGGIGSDYDNGGMWMSQGSCEPSYGFGWNESVPRFAASH